MLNICEFRNQCCNHDIMVKSSTRNLPLRRPHDPQMYLAGFYFLLSLPCFAVWHGLSFCQAISESIESIEQKMKEDEKFCTENFRTDFHRGVFASSAPINMPRGTERNLQNLHTKHTCHPPSSGSSGSSGSSFRRTWPWFKVNAWSEPKS